MKVKNNIPEEFGITNYRFNHDGTLDVFEDVFLHYKDLTELPFKFGKIFGKFNCSWNNLTSLKGCPEIVNGDFWCSNNNLKDLKYSPKIVNGYFWCSNNNLKDLKYVTEIINGDFWAINNNLKSLNGLNLDGIIGKIHVDDNPDLKLTKKIKLWMDENDFLKIIFQK